MMDEDEQQMMVWRYDGPDVQLVIEYLDGAVAYYPMNTYRTWKVDHAKRELVIGRGVPRVMIPLEHVRAYIIERKPNTGGIVPSGPLHAQMFEHAQAYGERAQMTKPDGMPLRPGETEKLRESLIEGLAKAGQLTPKDQRSTMDASAVYLDAKTDDEEGVVYYVPRDDEYAVHARFSAGERSVLDLLPGCDADASAPSINRLIGLEVRWAHKTDRLSGQIVAARLLPRDELQIELSDVKVIGKVKVKFKVDNPGETAYTASELYLAHIEKGKWAPVRLRAHKFYTNGTPGTECAELRLSKVDASRNLMVDPESLQFLADRWIYFASSDSNYRGLVSASTMDEDILVLTLVNVAKHPYTEGES